MTRITCLSAFVLLALSATSHAFLTAQDAVLHKQAGPRKSLGFGPRHAHHKYISNRYTSKVFAKSISTENLYQIALDLAVNVSGKQDGVDYFVRSDSYNDPTSGLTFIYVKQTIHGLQVEDGDMNVVLSSDGEHYGLEILQAFASLLLILFFVLSQAKSYLMEHHCIKGPFLSH